MKVIVDGAAGTVAVEDTEDLKSLSVVLREADDERADALLTGFGWVDGQHAWLDIDTLRSHGPLPRPADWDAHFSATMAWAKEKGWTEMTGQYIRAHIEQPGA